jgi:hypothetical protein
MQNGKKPVQILEHQQHLSKPPCPVAAMPQTPGPAAVFAQMNAILVQIKARAT